MKVTERGQITIPKRLREKYGITPATEVELLEADSAIMIVKRGAVSRLERFRGIARKDGGPGRTDDLLTWLRDPEEG